MHEGRSSRTAGAARDVARGVGLGRVDAFEASRPSAAPFVPRACGPAPRTSSPPSTTVRPAGHPSSENDGVRDDSLHGPRERQAVASLLDPAGVALTTFPITVSDISETGASLAIPDPLWPGCVLRLELPGAAATLLATVARAERSPDGGRQAVVRFVALGAAERHEIRRLLAGRRQSDPGGLTPAT